MIRSTTISIILLVLRLTVGGLFLFAAYHKLRPGSPDNPLDDPTLKFLFSIEAFKILPHQLVEPAAWTIPWLELIAGLILVFGLWTRSAALALTALMGAFMWGIWASLNSGNVDIDCGCFGGNALFCPKDKLTQCHLWQDAAIVGATAILLLTGAGRFSIDGLFCRRPDDDGGDDEYHAPPSRIVEGRPAGL